MNIKYSIKPFIYNTNETLAMFLSEIHQLNLSEIQDIIDSCDAAMNDENEELYWGWNVSSLDMKKEISILKYNNEFVAEIPTLDIYNMLKDYRDALIKYNESQP